MTQTYHVSGTYKRRSGTIGRVSYARIGASSALDALDSALTRLQRRKAYAGGASLLATANPL